MFREFFRFFMFKAFSLCFLQVRAFRVFIRVCGILWSLRILRALGSFRSLLGCSVSRFWVLKV